MTEQTDLIAPWRGIVQAGGIPAWVGAQLAARNLFVTHRDAATLVHYRRFVIPKRGGGERAIWAPMPQLKAAQHWILRNVVEKLPVHGAVHGFLPGRSTLSNAAAHTDPRLVLKMDVKDF